MMFRFICRSFKIWKTSIEM